MNAILDIGGSTTDITLWANDVLVWKGSFRLAGRAFFTETIVQNPKLLREIELSDWADLLDPDKGYHMPQEIAADVGELLFSRPALGEAFDKHWNRRLNVKPGEVLRTTALAYLSGIAYYLGLVAGRLVKDGVLSAADLARPAFALCGRGAGIFDRLHGKLKADQESQVTNALRTFSKAAEIPTMPRPQIFLSKQPKLEVAAGMMVNFETINAKAGNGVPKSTFTPAGLALDLVDGGQLDPDTAIGTSLGAGSTRGSDLATLSAFLAAFDEFTGIEIDLRPSAGQGAFNEINTAVRQKVDRQKDDSGALVLVEPPFITALGALVAIMAGPEEERNTRLGGGGVGMNRNLLIYTSLAVALLLAAAATVWFGVFTPIAQDLSKLLPDRMILLSLVAGAAGGAATTALWHYSSTRRTLWSMNNQLQQLDRSHTSLRKTVQANGGERLFAATAVDPRELPPITCFASRGPPVTSGSDAQGRRPIPFPHKSSDRRNIRALPQSRVGPPLQNRVSRRFSSPSARPEPSIYVEPNRIASSENAESFLTGVKAGGSILVFPSYDSSRTKKTQFKIRSRASLENVSALFTLTRGNGDIMLETPAIFNRRRRPISRKER